MIGELSIITEESNHFTDVISEEQSKVVIFPYQKFKAADDDTEVSVAYLIYSYILAEKLKHATAQSLLKKNVRSQKDSSTVIGILDTEKKSRALISSTMEKSGTRQKLFKLSLFRNLLKSSLRIFLTC